MASLLSLKYLLFFSLYLQDIARLLQEKELQEEKSFKRNTFQSLLESVLMVIVTIMKMEVTVPVFRPTRHPLNLSVK